VGGVLGGTGGLRFGVLEGGGGDWRFVARVKRRVRWRGRGRFERVSGAGGGSIQELGLREEGAGGVSALGCLGGARLVGWGLGPGFAVGLGDGLVFGAAFALGLGPGFALGLGSGFALGLGPGFALGAGCDGGFGSAARV